VAPVWEALVDRQEASAVAFTRGETAFWTKKWLCLRLGAIHRGIAARQGPLKAGQVPVAVGEYVTGHRQGDPAGAIRIALVTAVTAHGRVAEVELENGTRIGAAEKADWKYNPAHQARLAGIYQRGGYFPNGMAYMGALKARKLKPAYRAPGESGPEVEDCAGLDGPQAPLAEGQTIMAYYPEAMPPAEREIWKPLKGKVLRAGIKRALTRGVPNGDAADREGRAYVQKLNGMMDSGLTPDEAEAIINRQLTSQ
jgi:hypothetical protein